MLRPLILKLLKNHNEEKILNAVRSKGGERQFSKEQGEE